MGILKNQFITLQAGCQKSKSSASGEAKIHRSEESYGGTVIYIYGECYSGRKFSGGDIFQRGGKSRLKIVK